MRVAGESGDLLLVSLRDFQFLLYGGERRLGARDLRFRFQVFRLCVVQFLLRN